jgi:hypothetical protein
MGQKEDVGMLGLKERPKPNRKFYMALASLAIVIFAAAAILLLLSPEMNKVNFPMNQTICGSSGGTWNECGSPCLGASQGMVCIMMCRQQCEWYAGNALLVKNDPAYSVRQGFNCMVQDNGITMCWLPGAA